MSSRARYELNEGVTAYKGLHYEQAIQHFQNAVRFDPELQVARLYLANSLAQQYNPGLETPENVKLAQDAIDQYYEILKRKRDDIDALKGIGSLHRGLKNFDEARHDFFRAIQAKPDDPELYYSIGVIDWTEVFRDFAREREKMGVNSSHSFIFDPGCPDLRARHQPRIEEGLATLVKAISLRDDYDDAMAYVNLLYRLQADLECGNPGYRAYDLQQADNWTNLAMEVRGKKIAPAPKQSTP